ncbi:hypothetical protein EVAR_60036_1 [Eumeta japonica]|uniref:Uncharacterized protein n=1 Tax=Eumeta variegata TaxID=151549 RepID=A0A4C1YZN0_EUMVA|nr:hypothetical protein EVAR_60036_1 [Eumeta japonica]
MSLTERNNRYVITELLQSDLHKIIVSPQHLSADHIKVFLYQILRVLWKARICQDMSLKVAKFLASNPDFYSAELRSVKTST